MLTKTVTFPLSESQRELNGNLRDFAQAMRVVQVCPIKSIAISAIEENFPGLLARIGSLEEALEELGFVVIRNMGQGYDPKRVSWSIADSEQLAIAQQEQFMQLEYRAVRKAFEIDYHWVFFVPDRDLYSYSSDILVDGSGDFRDDGRPECWIFDRFQ